MNQSNLWRLLAVLSFGLLFTSACDELMSSLESDAGTEMDGGAKADGGSMPVDAGDDDAMDAGDAGDDDEMDAGDGAMDGGMGSDAGVGITCGSSFCTGGEVCCGEQTGLGTNTYCAPSCATDGGGLTLACDDKTDCGQGELCCANIRVAAPDGGYICPLSEGTAACSSSCTTNIPFTCPTQATVVLCQTQAECANQGEHDECCMFAISGLSTQFCASSFVQLSLQSQGCVQ